MDNDDSAVRKERLVISGEYKNLNKVRNFIAKIARKAGFTEEDTYKIQLAVDEACTNIIEHGYGAERAGKIECLCDFNDEELVIHIFDSGMPFNIEDFKPPIIVPDLDKRKVGGLGIYFMKKLMDVVKYKSTPIGSESEGARFLNELVLVKRRK